MSTSPFHDQSMPAGGADQPVPPAAWGQPAGVNPYEGVPAQPGEPGYADVAPPSSRRAIGWVGVVVLYLLALWQLVIPSIITLVQSTRQVNPFAGGGGFVGLDNWSRMMPELFPALGFALVAVLPVTLVAAVLGLPIGAAMTPQQRLATPTRVLVGVMSALFVPLGIGISRLSPTEPISSPESARVFIIVSVTIAALPLLTAGFATAFAFVLAGNSGGRGVATVVILGVAGALAVGPQLFDLPAGITAGGPQNATVTPVYLMYQYGFVMAEMGLGAAVGSALLLLAGLLGIVATLVLVLRRTRLAVAEGGMARAGGSTAGVLAGVLAIVVLAAMLVPHLPIFKGSFVSAPEIAPPNTALMTWLPTALGTIAQVAIAVLGGAAIGWCRPAGRRSLWLLLPLAPWLFVGPGPLLLQTWSQFQDFGLDNTVFSLMPQPLVVVAAVVIMALFFASWGEQPSRTGRRATGAAVLGVIGVLLVTQAQSLLPALALNVDPARLPAPVAAMRALQMLGYAPTATDAVLGMLYPIPAFLVVAAIGVVAQLGLRRVVALQE